MLVFLCDSYTKTDPGAVSASGGGLNQVGGFKLYREVAPAQEILKNDEVWGLNQVV